MAFLFDWTLRLGIIAISKSQTKSFEELKKMADAAWDKKWAGAGYKTDPRKGGD